MMQAPQPRSTLLFQGTETDAQQQHDRGSRLAQGLRSLGLQPGDVVAVHLRNGLEYADVVHACRIGGISYCPLNWHFTAQEINFILRDSGAKALITSQALLDGLQQPLHTSIPRLVVGAGGFLEGDVIARDVHVEGRLEGRIFALNVTLDSTAEVNGRIFHNTITFSKGARIDARMPWRPPSYFETLETLPEARQ